MLRYTEAQETICSHAHSFGKETVSLDDAVGRVLFEKIFADRDYPPFNRSAMDGFALKYADVEKGIRHFKMIDTIYAGQSNEKQLHSGQCFKIMTGAAVPTEADLVIRKEDAGEMSDLITIETKPFKLFQHIAKKGEDVSAGKLVIDKPVVITPSIISLLAALGKGELVVERLPRIAIITTGNEVRSIDSNPSSVQIRNSNASLLKALIKKQLGLSVNVHHVPDDPNLLEHALTKVLDADIIISSGGVSAGEADYVPHVLNRLGIQKIFHKVAIKPGKPIWCGRTSNNGIVFALPGNPLSCLVTFTIFVLPYLSACFQLPPSLPREYTLAEERIKKSDFDEFFPVKFEDNSNQLRSVAFNGSGDIQAALFADGLALHPYNKRVINHDNVGFFAI